MFYTRQHPLHALLDGPFQEYQFAQLLADGADPNLPAGPLDETPLHVAVRRRRLECIDPLYRAGADLDARTRGGKTAYAHAARRGFFEIVDKLADLGAETSLNTADQLAVALVRHDLETARELVQNNPELVPNLGPEEARILPDLAGRPQPEAVELLLQAGIDLTGRGLDGGTALHQAAWFGQPACAAVLLNFGAPVNIGGDDHHSTPLGWVAHGSTYSGGAAERQEAYVELARLYLEAGASLAHPLHPERDAHGAWLLADASPAVQAVLMAYGAKR